MSNRMKKYAFTMIELIFVIVIMGILGKFGTEFLANAYESFLFSKINNNLQERSGSAVEFISKRLESRIKQSVIARNITTGTYNFVNGSGLSDENATILEWISTDIDSFRGTTVPLWSGVLDLNIVTSTNAKLVSPSSDFNATSISIANISPSGKTLTGAALYFIDSATSINSWGYDGNIATQTETLHPIQIGANNDELVSGNAVNFLNMIGSEYYKLVSTAYAIELGDYNDTTKIGNLYLHYDYRPWLGETYLNGTRRLLSTNINTFRFRGSGSFIKIQVCAKSDLTSEEYALCKEKTVY